MDESAEPKSKEDSKDTSEAKEELIHLPHKHSKGRRGSSTFLTSDDNIIMAFGSGRRLSSFCTTSSYEWVETTRMCC